MFKIPKKADIWKIILRVSNLLRSKIIKKETKSTYLRIIVSMRNSKNPIKKN